MGGARGKCWGKGRKQEKGEILGEKVKGGQEKGEKGREKRERQPPAIQPPAIQQLCASCKTRS